METIGSRQLWSLLDKEIKVTATSNTKVRGGAGHQVHSYLELARKVAELQYRNPDYIFFFRGQGRDHKNRLKNSSLPPTMFRGAIKGGNWSDTLRQRFEKLHYAEQCLIDLYQQSRFIGREKLKRHQILRWSILQHYNVCPTPLLDVSQSLRIGASFASDRGSEEAFLFVLGVPNISGAITASAEAGVEIVRLSSVCPPEAVRPHIQEGYLLGEYPELHNYEQKQHYKNYEIDFGLRLAAKFRFIPNLFWGDKNFPMVPHEALYPLADPLYDLTQSIKQRI